MGNSLLFEAQIDELRLNVLLWGGPKFVSNLLDVRLHGHDESSHGRLDEKDETALGFPFIPDML